MWLHESESSSLIRQACKNKIFLTIIYISYNSRAKLQLFPIDISNFFLIYQCLLSNVILDFQFGLRQLKSDKEEEFFSTGVNTADYLVK